MTENINGGHRTNNYYLERIELNTRGGAGITVDDELSSTSENPVQNKVITLALEDKADTSGLSNVATSGSYTDLEDKPTIPTVVDTVADGNSNAVTSNAVYDYVASVIGDANNWLTS